MAASNDDNLNDTSFSTGSYRSLETSQQLQDDDDDCIVPETPPSDLKATRRDDSTANSRQEAAKPPQMSHQNARSSRTASPSNDPDTPPSGASSVRSLGRSGPPSGASSIRSLGRSRPPSGASSVRSLGRSGPRSGASSIRSSGSSNSRENADDTTIPLELQELETDGVQKENVHAPASKSEERVLDRTESKQYISKGVSSSSTSKPSQKIQNPFVASTPVMSSNRKLMNAQVFSNLDVTNINFEKIRFGGDEDSSSEDESGAAFNQTRGPTNHHRSSSSSDVRAVSSSEADESSGDVKIVDEYLGEDEVVVGAVAPVRQQDIDLLTDKMRQQTLQNKKPLMKFIEEPPGPPPRPLADKYENYVVPLAPGASEWTDDVTKALNYLVNGAEQMPNPLEDPNESEFVSPKRLRVELFPYQKYGVRWMSWRESSFPYGGILADEMGLGKTVMVMSVVLQVLEKGHSQEDEVENWLTPISRKLVPTQATLVVCPASCMKQWETELATKAKGLRVYIYHGPKRTDSAAVLSQHHVVICPYSTITSEIPKPDDDPYNKCRSPLLRLHWSRIVLDEGHIIRNPKTAGSQAICRIEAKRRWVVTGTPIHNKADDFYSLIKFLKLKPFDDKSCWKFWIGGPKELSRDGVARLHLIGKAITLRRVKAEITNCEIAKLPPKVVEDVVLELSEEERSVYDHLEQYAKQQYENYVASLALQRQNGASNFIAGSNDNGGIQDPKAVRFSHLFALILRLRQMSILPFLIKTMLGEEEDASDDESYDVESDPVNRNNPIFQIGYKSSKIRRVLHDVEEIRKSAKPGQPMDKIIIVSQWTTLLSIVQQHLEKRSYRVVTITGQDSFEERAAAMTNFNTNPKRPQILLLSIVAGGVGLNLVGGNYVFFLEPHWNPQLERQAQDRVHRYGQKKPVIIRRYICEATIESRVLELQQKKLELADGLLDSTKKQSTGAGLNMKDMQSLFGLGTNTGGRVRPPRK